MKILKNIIEDWRREIMNKVAQFEKVSLEQFIKDMLDTFNGMYTDDEIEGIYETIKLPKRATKGSAGYDFYTHIPFSLEPKHNIKIPTGIKVKKDNDWVLQIFPRSGLGVKYKVQLENTVGIVDSDYVNSDNEGHIFICIKNTSNKPLTLNHNDAITQAFVVPFGVADKEEVATERVGGIGSTSK